MVQLVVLGTEKPFVVEANAVKELSAESAQEHAVYLTFLLRITEGGAAMAKGGTQSQGNSLTDVTLAHRPSGPSNVVSPCPMQIVQALTDIIRRQEAVTIHTKEHLASSISDADVQGRRYDTAGVVH